ncbi:hypothetical protein CF386_00965 [Paraphotobacterium marinum]|uniref:UPF0208 membrane protein YfbV n=1 Tax=Paraphotobacterium marinum TaxID=1755811 RepID=A0A220VBM8_9GAMM|nr:terminus macrodomain insulation protein YfbV [Paraphotobacterium marinum]ASK77755.1 hypothetical protein CF386_00965 [Paraphotobacterium marinum]
MRNFISKLSTGLSYLDKWPLRKELAGIFPDIRVIIATKFALKSMPGVAILSICMAFYFRDDINISVLVLTSIISLLIPCQGLIWLAHRSEKRLPNSLIEWYRDIANKLTQQGYHFSKNNGNLTYKDLGLILKCACQNLDKDMLKRWF